MSTTQLLSHMKGKKFGILVWYRGVFCPYCTKWMTKWADQYGVITMNGGQLIGITSDPPDVVEKTTAMWKAPFPIISDPKLKLTNIFGVSTFKSPTTVNANATIIAFRWRSDLEHMVTADLNSLKFCVGGSLYRWNFGNSKFSQGLQAYHRPLALDTTRVILMRYFGCSVRDSHGFSQVIFPPQGTVTFVSTDIQGSTTLWEEFEETMPVAISIHNGIMRKLAVALRGFLVATEGDAFVIAFETAGEAVQFCASAQRALLGVEWPQALSNSQLTESVLGEDNRLLWNGFRVRMAVHTMTDYEGQYGKDNLYHYGTAHETILHEIEGVTLGGFIALSLEAFQAFREDNPEDYEFREQQSPGLEVRLLVIPELQGRFQSLRVGSLAPIPSSQSLNPESRVASVLKATEAQEGLMKDGHPIGLVTIVFGGCSSIERLLEHDLAVGTDVCHKMQEIMRECIPPQYGYEAKIKGNGLMLAFNKACEAVRYCLTVQEKIMQTEWPSILAAFGAGKEAIDNTVIWNGPRVHFGLNSGPAVVVTDPVSRRADYFGTVVNRAARVSMMAEDGYTFISEATKALLGKPTQDVTISLVGQFELKGVGGKNQLYTVSVPRIPRPFPKIIHRSTINENDPSLEDSCQTILSATKHTGLFDVYIGNLCRNPKFFCKLVGFLACYACGRVIPPTHMKMQQARSLGKTEMLDDVESIDHCESARAIPPGVLEMK